MRQVPAARAQVMMPDGVLMFSLQECIAEAYVVRVMRETAAKLAVDHASVHNEWPTVLPTCRTIGINVTIELQYLPLTWLLLVNAIAKSSSTCGSHKSTSLVDCQLSKPSNDAQASVHDHLTW